MHTYRIVVEAADRPLALVLFDVDHLVLSVDAVAVVIKRHLPRQAEHVARFQIVENALACRSRAERASSKRII